MEQQVLVLGANGRCGQAVAEAFADAGWLVHAQVRRAWSGRASPRIRPLEVPVEATEQLLEVARGSSIVVHALNPPYREWDRQIVPLGQAALRITRALGATLMLPGNVYNFGDPIPGRMTESTPFAPNHAKARQRCELEARLATDPAVRSIVVRAGDFYGLGRGNWIDLVILAKLQKGTLTYPGPLEVVHTWAYLPDLARTFVLIAERADSLPHASAFHFPGHAVTGARFLDALARAARELGAFQGAPRIRRMSWGPLRVIGLIAPLYRQLARMSYLWRQPHVLASEHLGNLIGPVPDTPLPQAAAATIAALYAPKRPRAAAASAVRQ